jgi:hypothetical protein
MYNQQPSMKTGQLQTTYCNGNDSVSANTAAFNPSAVNTIGPHSGVILLKSK